MPILSDFGDARIGDVHEGLIQPDIYRAPEVILGKKWTSKVDIWNVGTLVSDVYSHSEETYESPLTRESLGLGFVRGPPSIRW